MVRHLTMPAYTSSTSRALLLLSFLLAAASLAAAQTTSRLCVSYGVTTTATTNLDRVATQVDNSMRGFLRKFSSGASYSLSFIQNARPMKGTLKVKFSRNVRADATAYLKANLTAGALKIKYTSNKACNPAPSFLACKAYDVFMKASLRAQAETEVKHSLNVFKTKFKSSTYTLTRKKNSKGFAVSKVQVDVRTPERLFATTALDQSLKLSSRVKRLSEVPCTGKRLCKGFQLQFQPKNWRPLRKSVAFIFDRKFVKAFPGSKYQLLRFGNRAQLRLFLNREFDAPRAFILPLLKQLKIVKSVAVEDCYDFRRTCRAWSISSLTPEIYPTVQQDVQDVVNVLKATYPKTTYELKRVTTNNGTNAIARLKVQLRTAEQDGAYNWLLENLNFANVQYAKAVRLIPCGKF